MNFFLSPRSFFLISLLIPFVLSAGDATITQNMVSYSTIYSIGLEWHIDGDDDHDAVCSVEYRILGYTSWFQAMSLYRVDFRNHNMLAGSILFLKPGTSYEVQLSLFDPDGGSVFLTDTVSTRVVPVMPVGNNIYHVIPGSGGGDGSKGNPFKGIEMAENMAQAGDVFNIHSGNYGGLIYLRHAGTQNAPIVWKAAKAEDPIFEGIRIEADYIWLDGLTIVDQQYGLRTSPPGPKDVNITHCTFLNNHYSIYLNDGGSGWYIADNIIIGDNDPGISDFSGEGIELWHTSGHTIAYNRISRTADGISYPHSNVDIFGNDIFDTSDDGIEGDFGHANVRIWRNRITNPRNNGISFQPMDGSPWYVLYNQVAVLGQDVIKLRDQSDRALIAHNTFIARSGPVSSGTGYLRNMEVKNNIWISIEDRYIWEESRDVNEVINWKTDFDYNGFDWGDYIYAFKWDNTRLDDIAGFNTLTGQEEHGIKIENSTCFDSLNFTGLVDSFFIEYNILNADCNAIDAGIKLPNINDGYIGAAPDLGAYEYGLPLPHYGPRNDISTGTALIGSELLYLKQNYPNPFKHYTTINFTLDKKSLIDLTVYDLFGKRVSTIFKGLAEEGKNQFVWAPNLDKVFPGLYFYVINLEGNLRYSGKMIIN